MKILFLCFLLLSLAPLASLAQEHYWQQELHYTIDVRLHDDDHTLDGFMKLNYVNHSPDTLSYMWFHLWPNAFKNDRTALSEQLLRNGRTNFYFSDREQRGYINHLDFRTGNASLRTEDHPQYIDIVKVMLSAPLPPGDSCIITTPFHVQLPFNFSRGGHVDHRYQITQWYPKPAVYDREGWHPMPYLEQGEFYSEFGSFDVRITLPQDYVVAATGELQDEPEKKWMLEKQPLPAVASRPAQWGKRSPSKSRPPVVSNRQAVTAKTLVYRQHQAHDFAWFADKNYVAEHDTLQLPSGKLVQLWAFYRPNEKSSWRHVLAYLKRAVQFRSGLIGEYPYNTVSVVSAPMGFPGGMEYPTIASIHLPNNPRALNQVIEHEVGHNWFYGALASNERDHPWMDEGMNTYYDERYRETYDPPHAKKNWLGKKIPANPEDILLATIEHEKEDQPISTPSEAFTIVNYGLVTYTKTARWMQQLEHLVGRPAFDTLMREYYRQWRFRHPSPDDFRQVMERSGNSGIAAHFELLNKTGPLTPPVRKKIRPTFMFNFRHTDSIHYISIGAPLVGYNYYNGVMLGGIVHNYNLPSDRLRFVAVPLYAINSNTLAGLGRISYNWYPEGAVRRVEVATGVAGFSYNQSLDTNGRKVFENFFKVVPSVRVWFRHPMLSHVSSWIDLRSFLITEHQFAAFREKSSVFYPVSFENKSRYVNQLSAGIENSRVLYPYSGMLQLQQGDGFYRVNLTGNYFFNYSKGGGLAVRLFGARFGYIGPKKADTYIYQPALVNTGADDYTYSHYFVGRTASFGNAGQPVANKGLGARQIMIRDGGFKLRVDQFGFLQGRSENWVAAINLNSTLPGGLLPIQLPLRLFFDAGTYAEAWKIRDAPTSRFLYEAGLQLSLFHDVVNIYAPVFFSSEYRENLASLPGQHTFFKRITFSIDLQRLSLGELAKARIPF